VEIDQAGWFDIKNLPNVPPSNISISGKLIEAYINKFN
jgi:NADH pyrophosphatase NudC (nudix superfamily)